LTREDVGGAWKDGEVFVMVERVGRVDEETVLERTLGICRARDGNGSNLSRFRLEKGRD
jgi:hypothetical protein